MGKRAPRPPPSPYRRQTLEARRVYKGDKTSSFAYGLWMLAFVAIIAYFVYQGVSRYS